MYLDTVGSIFTFLFHNRPYCKGVECILVESIFFDSRNFLTVRNFSVLQGDTDNAYLQVHIYRKNKLFDAYDRTRKVSHVIDEHSDDVV